MITIIKAASLKLVVPFTVALPLFGSTIFSVLILIDQSMLTDTNNSTCGGTLFLVQEITVIIVITVKTFEKTLMSLLAVDTWNFLSNTNCTFNMGL